MFFGFLLITWADCSPRNVNCSFIHFFLFFIDIPLLLTMVTNSWIWFFFNETSTPIVTFKKGTISARSIYRPKCNNCDGLIVMEVYLECQLLDRIIMFSIYILLCYHYKMHLIGFGSQQNELPKPKS